MNGITAAWLDSSTLFRFFQWRSCRISECKNLSWAIKTDLRAGAELLFLSRSAGFMSDWGTSVSAGQQEIPFLLLYFWLFSCRWWNSWKSCLRIPLPIWMDSGSLLQNTHLDTQKSPRYFEMEIRTDEQAKTFARS